MSRIIEKEIDMPLTDGLSHREFRCKCPYQECRATLVDEGLMLAYRNLRLALNQPLKINSGYRCQRHNASKSVLGSVTSKHCAGSAIDISFKSLKDEYSQNLFKALAYESGFAYVKYYDKGDFFHCHV